MKVWVGMVEHKYGTNSYAGRTRELLVDQIYEYVKEWWDREISSLPFPEDEKKEQVVDRYFDLVEGENLTMDQLEVA